MALPHGLALGVEETNCGNSKGKTTMKRLFTILTLGLLLMPTLYAQPPVNQPLRIAIRPNAAGNPSNWVPNDREAEYVRQQLIAALTRRCGSACVVIEAGYGDTEEYDASLGVSWSIQDRCEGCGIPAMVGTARLVGEKRIVLWSDSVSSGRHAKVLSLAFANDAALKLVKHLTEHPSGK